MLHYGWRMDPRPLDWSRFETDGFLHLGPLLTPEEVAGLCERADDLALGRVAGSDAIRFQRDTGGAYEELPTEVERFDEGTLLYRKIQGLETDDRFSPLVRHDRIREVCARLYGPHAPVSLFRAMVMNKPAGQGTVLPWHQDGGDVWALDRDPLVTVWVALDPATVANGCMEVVPGSHRLGLLTAEGSTVREDHAAIHCPPERRLPLEVEPGHGVLLHNWLIHRSGVNTSPISRRAFTGCYLDGRTRNRSTGDLFPPVFGTPPPAEFEIVTHLRESGEAAREYALSLQAENALLRESAESAATYARSLEAELERIRAAVDLPA